MARKHTDKDRKTLESMCVYVCVRTCMCVVAAWEFEREECYRESRQENKDRNEEGKSNNKKMR